MAIYKYTLVKYLRAKSTWIIGIFAALLIGFAIPAAAFSGVSTDKATSSTDYAVMVVALVAGVTSFMSIFASVFAGFKAASMYKDEVEDGTFLVILSKPMKRSTIIFMKWLALQTVILGYTLFTVLSFAASVAIFDHGDKIQGLSFLGMDTLSSHLGAVIGFSIAILFAISLIFSSIALLLSTKLSVGSTIGISIALGVVIPITSLVGLFTKKDEFKQLQNRDLFIQQQTIRASNNILQKMTQGVPISGVSSSGVSSVLADQMQAVKNIDDYLASKDVQDMYKLGVATGETNNYNWAFALDLNYQVNTLAGFASEQAIPDSAKQFATAVKSSSTSTNAPGLGSTKVVQDQAIRTQRALMNKVIATYDAFTKPTAGQTLSIRDQMAKSSLEALALSIKAETTVDSHGLTFGNQIIDIKSLNAGNVANNYLMTAASAAHTTMASFTVNNAIDALTNLINLGYDKLIDPNTTDKDAYALYKEKSELFGLIEAAAQSYAPDASKSNGVISHISQIKEGVTQVEQLFTKLESPITSFLINAKSLKSAFDDSLKDSEKAKATAAILNKFAKTDSLELIKAKMAFQALTNSADKDLTVLASAVVATDSPELKAAKTAFQALTNPLDRTIASLSESVDKLAAAKLAFQALTNPADKDLTVLASPVVATDSPELKAAKTAFQALTNPADKDLTVLALPVVTDLINTDLLSKEDKTAIIQLLASSAANKLAYVKSIDYVNKNALLFVYIAIALALVPLTYWVVKKQDFR